MRSTSMEPHDELSTEALLAIQTGRRLEAIRIVREQTGLGLAEAKRLVDRTAGTLGPQAHWPRKVAATEDAGTLRLLAVLLVLGGIAVALLML